MVIAILWLLVTAAVGTLGHVDVVAQLATGLPLDRFLEDPKVIQTFEKGKTTSVYTLSTDSSLTFESKSYDSDKETVALPYKPKLTSKQNKVYVVFRKCPRSNTRKGSNHYFIFLSYFRNGENKTSEDNKEVGDYFSVEWDSWENRPHRFKNKKLLLGWMTCANSVFFSCKGNETQFAAADTKKEIKFVSSKSNFSHLEGQGDFEDLYTFLSDLDESHLVVSRSKGRSLFTSSACTHCKLNETKSSYVPPSLSNPNSSVQAGRTFGAIFEVGEGAIFIPWNKGVQCLFVADSEDTENAPLVHGVLYAPVEIFSPLTFVPDRKSMVKNLKNLKGTMVLDLMAEAAMDGGIRGSLSARPNGAIFVSDSIPAAVYLHPENVDLQKVFFPSTLMDSQKESKEKQNGVLFIGSDLNVFIPTGMKLPGFFSPDDPNSEVDDVIHGFLIPRNQTDNSVFETHKGLRLRNETARGKFLPDDMPSGGFIAGTLAKSGDSFTFSPDQPAQDFIYNSSDSMASDNIWVAPLLQNKSMLYEEERSENSGILFVGKPKIFFPEGRSLIGFLVIDKSNEEFRGRFYPTEGGKPSRFEPLDKITKTMKEEKSRFVPDALHSNNKKDKQGVQGTFTTNASMDGGAFKANPPGKKWTYDGKEVVWMPNSTNELSESSADGFELPQGILFRGSIDKYGIFIPENEGVPGIVIPEKRTYPSMKGIFYAGKPNQPASFYPEDVQQTANKSLSVVFSADGIRHPAQGIKGISTSGTDPFELTFRPDIPSKAYIFDPKNSENEEIWTPFIPGFSTNTETVKEDTNDEDDNTLYGHLFSEMGADDGVFLPFDIAISGTIVFASRKYPKIPGRMIVYNNGKSPTYYPDDQGAVSKMFNVRGIFMADGLPRVYGGIRGFFTAGVEGSGGTFRTDLVGQFHAYNAEKDDEMGIWKPPDAGKLKSFGPEAVAKNGPTAATAMIKSFFRGTYFRPQQAGAPLFISTDGKPGWLSRPSTNIKFQGVLYPENPPKFVSDDNITFANKTVVQFTSERTRGEAVNSFLGTFYSETATEPASIVPSDSSVHGWTNWRAPNPLAKGHNYVRIKDRWKNDWKEKESGILKNGIAVGGGYKGYETQGKSLEGLIDATSPTFKEFLEKRSSVLSRQAGKYVDIPLNIFLTAGWGTGKDYKFLPPALEVINSSEYRTWLLDNYMVTKTTIKTDNVSATVEIGVPKAAKEYLIVKKKKRFNVIINTEADASVNASGNSSGVARGGVTTSIGNCKPLTTSATAAAQATNGSTAEAEATAKNGGTANSLSKASNGATAKSKAEAEDKGVANSKANAANGGSANALSSGLGGGKANAGANSVKGKDVDAKAVAKSQLHPSPDKTPTDGNSTNNSSEAECQDDMVDEIVVESSAVAHALATKDQSSGSSSANTQVRLNLAGLVAKLVKKGEEEDDDDTDTIDIHINANSLAQASGRAIPASTGKANSKKSTVWKMDDVKEEVKANCTLLHEDILFYGLGSCLFQKKTYAELQEIRKAEDIIDFYLAVLRTGCSSKEKLRTILLIVDSLLEFDDKILVFPTNHPYLNESKLTGEEMHRLTRAFQLSIFSKTYVFFGENESWEVSDSLSPDGSRISRSVRFLTEWALISMEESVKNLPLHLVHFTRNCIITLRTVLTRLEWDWRRLDKCEECELDKQVNYNDRLQIVALIHFILRGLFSLESSTPFNDFYMTNKEALQQRVLHAHSLLTP